MSAASKGGGGPGKPTIPRPPLGQGRDSAPLDRTTEVGLAHTIASTGQTGGQAGGATGGATSRDEVVMSAQLPGPDAIPGGRPPSSTPISGASAALAPFSMGTDLVPG